MADTTSILQEIPGTEYVALTGDSNLTPRAIESGSIIIEKELAALPEVQALRPGDIVLDIGAFIGDTARLFLDRGCPVYAFEPYKDAFDALHHNCPEASLHNVAVGDGRPLRLLHEFGEDNQNYGTRMVADGGEVPSLRIDDLKLPRVDFIKLDVEGCEVMALDGMLETLRRCRPVLLVEAYTTLLAKHNFTRADLLDRLTSVGYRWRVAIGSEDDDRLDYLAFPVQR